MRAIYPGSFDPIHNGHLDVIIRASNLWEKVTVAIFSNPSKNTLFTKEKRLELAIDAVCDLNNVEVKLFDGLLVNFVKSKKSNLVIRGLRAISDFEFEFQMALMNKSLDSSIETVFLMPLQKNIYLSSHLIKEVAKSNGNVEKFVPNNVCNELNLKFNKSSL